jgi:transposase
MFNFSTSLRIYLHVKPVDMRKAFNGLYAVAKHELGKDPMDGSLFVFCNQSHNRVKLLYFDGTGFWVMAKRLERGTFWWPAAAVSTEQCLDLKHESLALLLNGIDLNGCKLRGWFCR